MDPGANAARHNLCAGKCRPHRRKRRSLLGRALLPKLRHSWSDHAQTDCRIDRCHLRVTEVLCAVFYPRQRNSDKKTILAQFTNPHLHPTIFLGLSATGTFSTTSMSNPSRAASLRG